MVWHLIAGHDIVADYSSSASTRELSSFKFGLCLFLPMYSRTIMIDRYCAFTELEEDAYELGVMSKFFTGMKMIFASVPQLHEVFHRVHK